jgi:hypothetical protein
MEEVAAKPYEDGMYGKHIPQMHVLNFNHKYLATPHSHVRFVLHIMLVYSIFATEVHL